MEQHAADEDAARWSGSNSAVTPLAAWLCTSHLRGDASSLHTSVPIHIQPGGVRGGASDAAGPGGPRGRLRPSLHLGVQGRASSPVEHQWAGHAPSQPTPFLLALLPSLPPPLLQKEVLDFMGIPHISYHFQQRNPRSWARLIVRKATSGLLTYAPHLGSLEHSESGTQDLRKEEKGIASGPPPGHQRSMQVLAGVLAAPRPLQLPADAPGHTAEGGPSAGALHHVGAHGKPLSPCFSLCSSDFHIEK